MGDNFILIPLLVGPIFILAGFLMVIYPPRKINYLYGYRTRSSMKTQKRWRFAQKYSAKELIKFGGILLLTSMLGFVVNIREDYSIIIGFGLMITAIVLLFIKTEKAIKNQFPE